MREEGAGWALGRWGSLRCRMGPSGQKWSQVSDSKHWASLSHGKRPGKEIQTPVHTFLPPSTHYAPPSS